MDSIKTDITTHSADGEPEVRKPLLDYKDIKNLKKAGYEKMNEKWPNTYVLQHKSGKIAELKAVSSLHACNLIGWRSRHVKILSKVEVEKKDDRTNQ